MQHVLYVLVAYTKVNKKMLYKPPAKPISLDDNPKSLSVHVNMAVR